MTLLNSVKKFEISNLQINIADKLWDVTIKVRPGNTRKQQQT